jgi:hypothetical protein
MRIIAGVEGLVESTGDGRTCWVLSGRTIERSGDTVCGLYHARGAQECGFLGLASKPRAMVCQQFGLRTTRTISLDLASKPVATVSPGLTSKLAASDFLVWTSKLVATVW